MALENACNKRGPGKNAKLVLFGFVSWLAPFLFSFLFYSPKGEPAVGAAFFNSIMGVALAVAAGMLLLLYFRAVSGNYLRESLKAGIAWLVINLALDILILVPFAKMGIGTYFTDIGLGYLVIPVIAVIMGKIMDEKLSHSNKVVSQFASGK